MTRAGRAAVPLRAAAGLVLAVALAACHGRPKPVYADFGGDPERGAQVIAAKGCGACHAIPGIPGARGLVGPPLDHMGERKIVGGYLSNTPANLIRWVRDPQGVAPGNAMPAGGLTEQQARDVAAYLYTLR